jgi:hypothetical protein
LFNSRLKKKKEIKIIIKKQNNCNVLNALVKWEKHDKLFIENTSNLQEKLEKNFQNLAQTFGVVQQVIFSKQQYHLELQNIVTYDCKTLLLTTTVKQLPDGHELFSPCGDGLKFC